jgi:outer membrane protein
MNRKIPVALFLFLISGVTTYGQEQVSLEQVLKLALQSNYDVQVSRYDVEAAQTDDRYAIGGMLPQISAQGSTTWNDNDQTLRFQDASRNNSGDVRSNNLSGAVQLSWTLFDGTRMFATRERLSRVADQSELVLKDQMINTIATVVSSYYDVVRQKQQLRAIQEQMAVNEERVRLAEKKLQVGTGIKPELLQAKVDFNAQRTQVLEQEAIIAQRKEELNLLTGMQLPPQYDVADTIIIDLNIEPGESFENLDNTNFSLMAARERIGIAALSLRERSAEALPFVDFFSAYTYGRTDNTAQINPFGAVYNRTNGLNYGFSVTVPILSGFNNRRQVQLAKIGVQREQVLYDQQRHSVNVELRNAFITYENAKRILLIEEENIALARENVNIALETFKRGVSTFIELRTAQQSLEEAYTRVINARYNAKLAETELLKLNGSLLRENE